jgi:hypothetical protein
MHRPAATTPTRGPQRAALALALTLALLALTGGCHDGGGEGGAAAFGPPDPAGGLDCRALGRRLGALAASQANLSTTEQHMLDSQLPLLGDQFASRCQAETWTAETRTCFRDALDMTAFARCAEALLQKRGQDPLPEREPGER